MGGEYHFRLVGLVLFCSSWDSRPGGGPDNLIRSGASRRWCHPNLRRATAGPAFVVKPCGLFRIALAAMFTASVTYVALASVQAWHHFHFLTSSRDGDTTVPIVHYERRKRIGNWPDRPTKRLPRDTVFATASTSLSWQHHP